MTKARETEPMADLPYSSAEQWQFPHIEVEPGQPVHLGVGDYQLRTAEVGPVRFSASSRFILDHLMTQANGFALKSDILKLIEFLPGRAPVTGASDLSSRANSLMNLLGGKDVILGTAREGRNVRYYFCEGLAVVRVSDNVLPDLKMVPVRRGEVDEPRQTRAVMRRQSVTTGSSEQTPTEIRAVLGEKIRDAIKKGKDFNPFGLGLQQLDLARRELRAAFNEIETDVERERFKEISADLAMVEGNILANHRARA